MPDDTVSANYKNSTWFTKVNVVKMPRLRLAARNRVSYSCHGDRFNSAKVIDAGVVHDGNEASAGPFASEDTLNSNQRAVDVSLSEVR